ncbi:heparinase II/III family protein [Fibrella forsythiae]|uniref:Alginate lyase family protein n=1 Tax=Fibrella forsythiae TaxID=2817061 RepID=A0ABS3JTS3_9BACT|nr:heparinase II/III family protein [Fibrella forsythiae]MBO0952307.1 alginate lyase family protein [Fibrella forsythiae]
MKAVGLYWRTLRHLTLRQVVYQVWNRLRGRPRLRWVSSTTPTNVPSISFPITFTFLNQTVTFTDRIDWNHAANGKLWTYNLNYFDWLNLSTQATALIYDFIRQTDSLNDGLEPYPTSLRLLNWRAFLRQEGIQDALIERHLYAQTALLESRLEYHLGGNHLLENACALTTLAIHFQHKAWFMKGSSLLRNQLNEQVLTDGGHYERSPVYHQLLTDRLLDLYAVLEANTWMPDKALCRYVQQKTAAMLNWLVSVTFRDGSVPMVNDSAYGVAPATADILAKARLLGFEPTAVQLTDSGYRMLTTPRMELFIDVGPVGPDHQPGHAHADTFSFVLHIDGKPVVVDPGTSTYQIGDRRTWERSTAAHNTVTVANQNSSEVWSGFRVGRRARTRIPIDTPQCVEATHNGYAHLNEQHTRRWTFINEITLSICDHFINDNLAKKYYLYFDHCLYLTAGQRVIRSTDYDITFVADNEPVVNLSTYEQAFGFNRSSTASRATLNISTPILKTIFTVNL